MNRDRLAAVVARVFPGAALRHAERLTGGVSADVYRLDAERADGMSVSVVLRAHRASHTGHPARLEYDLLRALYRARVPVAEPLLVDDSGAVLADPFLVIAFVDGTTAIPAERQAQYIDTMADVLAAVHDAQTHELPDLPARTDPLPELFDYLPSGDAWDDLRAHLRSLTNTAYGGPPRLLHGDFWPENLLWQHDRVAAILDWEDAALGDPLSDVAGCRVELRYRYGTSGMQRFTDAYARHRRVDPERLALWQVYVAAAAQRFMGGWGLDAALELHMRREALASVREAGDVLMGRAPA